MERHVLHIHTMRSIPRRRFAVTWMALAVGLVTGCLSPTLPPLPPPSEPNVTAPVDGEVELSGRVPERTAWVLAFNGRTELVYGQFVQDHAYRFRMPAEGGDVLEFWYMSGGDQSEAVIVEVPMAESEPRPDAGAPGTGDTSTEE